MKKILHPDGFVFAHDLTCRPLACRIVRQGIDVQSIQVIPVFACRCDRDDVLCFTIDHSDPYQIHLAIFDNVRTKLAEQFFFIFAPDNGLIAL